MCPRNPAAGNRHQRHDVVDAAQAGEDDADGVSTNVPRARIEPHVDRWAMAIDRFAHANANEILRAVALHGHKTCDNGPAGDGWLQCAARGNVNRKRFYPVDLHAKAVQ